MNAKDAGMNDECWYCGDKFRVEAWTWNGNNAPMCRLHGATTRASLALRDAGKNDVADILDNAAGIDTRSSNKWVEVKLPR